MPRRILPHAIPFWLLGSTAAMAGPPFVTDDPVPVDYRHWEINIALTGTLQDGGGSASLPSVDANYGLLPGVQFHIQPQLAAVWGGGTTQVGFGDTQIGAKIKLIDEDKAGWVPLVSIYPIFTAPTGKAGRGLGAGVGQTFLPVWLDKTFGKWVIDGGAGYGINPGAGGRNAWFVGGLLLYQVTDALALGGEVFDQTAQQPGARNDVGFNLGGSYDFSAVYHVLFSAGRGSATRALGYLALQITF